MQILQFEDSFLSFRTKKRAKHYLHSFKLTPRHRGMVISGLEIRNLGKKWARFEEKISGKVAELLIEKNR